jgi:putative ABC transport system permease protein
MIIAMLSDLAYALRVSRSAPAFTVFVVGVLALGIGANTAIFSVLHAVLLRPLNYPEPDGLYQIAGTTARGIPTQIVPGAFEALRQGARTLENSALMRVRPFTILGDEGAESIYGQALAGDGLQVFGTAPIAGRLFAPGSSREVVLSHRLWVHRYQAAPSIVGRVVNLNGESYTVVGVMPPGFETANRPIFDLWLPWTFTTQELAERSAGGFPMVARRKGTASEAETRAEIATLGQVFERDLPSEQKGWRATLTPLKESRVGQHRATLWVLLGAVGFVLLIACLNVACLMMERAFDRKKEVAVRLALGASRWRLVRQFLVESSLISAAAGVVGLSVAWYGTRAVIALSPSRPLLPRLDQTSVDGWVLLFNFSVAAVVSLTFGLAPVWQVARITPRDGLQDSGRGFAGSRASQRARGFAVTLQAALSLVLLAGAGLMLRTFVNLIHVDPGFRPEGVLTVRIRQERAGGTK